MQCTTSARLGAEIHARRRIAICPVELRLEHPQQHLLTLNCGCFIRTNIPFDPLNQKQESNRAARHSLRVRHTITCQPLAQAFGFAYVEHSLCAPAEIVNAWIGRNLMKEIVTESLDQRLRRRKQP